MSTLAVGFALAVSPVGAQTITTDVKGLTAGEVQIPMADGKMIPAYRARPNGSSRYPTVLVVQEIFGVHEHIKDLCRRLAKAGYMAVAPEMFARQGDVSKIENVQEIIDNVVSKVPDTQVMKDLDSTAAWAAKNGGSADRLAITGFCWGGRIVWLYAAHNPKLQAGAAWYGRLEGDKNAMTPNNPIDYVGAFKALFAQQLLRQQRHRHLSRIGRADARRSESGRRRISDRRLSRRATWLQRRLSPQL